MCHTTTGRLLCAACVILCILACDFEAGCRSGGGRVSNEDEAVWALLDLASLAIINRDPGRFRKDIVERVKLGRESDLSAALKLCTRGDGYVTEYYEDVIVALLEATGDEKFCNVLTSSCDYETQASVRSVLAQYVWNADDERLWAKAKRVPDSRYPKTWRYVMAYIRD